MKYKIEVLAHAVDGQDGSGSVTLYANREAAVEELGEDDVLAIESNDDPYENGTFDKDTLEIEIVDGKAVLLNSPTFTTGQ